MGCPPNPNPPLIPLPLSDQERESVEGQTNPYRESLIYLIHIHVSVGTSQSPLSSPSRVPKFPPKHFFRL